MKCHECDRDFPSDLIHAVVTGDGAIPACPLCALKIRNALHGLLPGTPFKGKKAVRLWERAVAHLAKTAQPRDAGCRVVDENP